MMNKSFKLLSLSLLTLLTLVSFASAVVTFGTASISSVPQSSGSFTINVSGATGDSLPTLTASLTTPYTTNKDANGKNINFTFSPLVAFVTGTPQTVTVTYAVDSGFVFEAGKTYSVTITAGTATKTLLFAETNEPKEISSCKVTSAGNTENNLAVDIEDVTVLKGYGEDNDWYPLDEVEVEVLVENNGDADEIKSISVKWALYDVDSKKFVVDGKESSFNLDDGEDKTLRITFTLNENIDDFSDGDYKFYVWATGTDKNLADDNKTCTSDSTDVTINIDSHFVILDSLEVTGTASCGSKIQVTGTAWNLGDDNEDDVYIKVHNPELGIISQKVIVGDIDSLESQDFSFSLDIPSDAKDGKTYDIQLYVYDEDDDIFENDNNDQSRATISVNVPSGSCINEVSASVSALVLSNVKAGEEFDVKATVTNTGSDTATFTLSLDDYEWASLVEVDKTSLTLNEGASQDVLITLKANADASGEQTFNIILKEGTRVLNKPVPVSVEKTGTSFPITGGLFGSSNLYLYGIAGLNILLVLIIIIVAVRVVRKK